MSFLYYYMDTTVLIYTGNINPSICLQALGRYVDLPDYDTLTDISSDFVLSIRHPTHWFSL